MRDWNALCQQYHACRYETDMVTFCRCKGVNRCGFSQKYKEWRLERGLEE